MQNDAGQGRLGLIKHERVPVGSLYSVIIVCLRLIMTLIKKCAPLRGQLYDQFHWYGRIWIIVYVYLCELFHILLLLKTPEYR